jgi:hypothetical protein
MTQTKNRQRASSTIYLLLIVLLTLTAVSPVVYLPYGRLLAADWRVKVAHISALTLILANAFVAQRRSRRFTL